MKQRRFLIETPDVSTLNHSRLKVINNLLAEKEKLLQEMNDQVLTVCKVEEIEKEIEDSDVIRSRILEVKGRIECLDISKLSASVNTSPTTIDDMPHQQEVIAENSWAFCTEHAPNLARNPWGEGVKFNMAAYEWSVSWICLASILIERPL